MSPNLRVAVLLIISIAFINVDVCNGRTCVCASFLDTECNAKEYCTWNYVVPTTGTVKGNHGICRSTKWYTCHTDPDCKARLMNKYDYDAVSDWPLDKSLKSHPETNGDVTKDWPWDCATGEYADDVISVYEYDMASYDIQSILLDNNNNNINKIEQKEHVQSNLSLLRSIGTLPLVTTIIVFIALLCGFIMHIWYKCINKNKSLNDEVTTNYSTFGQI